MLLAIKNGPAVERMPIVKGHHEIVDVNEAVQAESRKSQRAWGLFCRRAFKRSQDIKRAIRLADNIEVGYCLRSCSLQ